MRVCVCAPQNETLDMFQREWYRLQGEGKLSEVDMGTVPDIYLRNQQLADQLKNMQVSIDQMKQISDKAKSTWDKFRKERDFHKMHHKRVVQEKNKLVVDLKRLKNHYANYEPMLKMMRGKYETAMKEKMLIKLERDRVDSRVSSLEAQVRLWDVRMVAEIAAIASGPHPCNAAAFDSSGSSLAVGCDDGIVRFISTQTCDIQHQMSGHNDAVQCCVFDRSGKFLVTGGSDATFRLWA